MFEICQAGKSRNRLDSLGHARARKRKNLIFMILSSFFSLTLVDGIVNAIVFTIGAILAPSILGVDINTLLLALWCISIGFVSTIYVTSAETFKVRDLGFLS